MTMGMTNDVQIASRGLPLNPVSLVLVSELAKDRVPRHWLGLVAPSVVTASDDCHSSLDAFRVKFVQRLQDFALWMSTELPTKIPLTHFQSTEVRHSFAA